MGVGHLPRLAQNELVLRLANHGLVLLGHLRYGLAELHKLCFCPLWSSARRTADGLSEQLQACCIGGRVHIEKHRQNFSSRDYHSSTTVTYR